MVPGPAYAMERSAADSTWGTLLLEVWSTHGVHPLARDQPEVLKLKASEVIVGRNPQCHWRLSKALSWISNKHLALGCTISQHPPPVGASLSPRRVRWFAGAPRFKVYMDH